MSEFKGTKGTWRIVKVDSIKGEIFITCDTIPIVSIAINDYVYENEAEANAKLISAAPDLLEALKVCYTSLCTYGKHPTIENQVENAIKKATL